MQWIANHWIAVLASYGAIVGTISLVIAVVLAKREVTEDVRIKKVFLTHKADHLRVEIVNHGTIAVPIRTVELYKPAVAKGYTLEWHKGDGEHNSPLERGHHSIYTRPVADVLGFMEVPGAYVAVMSNKGELARSEADQVASLVAKAQAARAK